MSVLPGDRRWRIALLVIMTLALGLRLGAASGLQYLLDHRWHRNFLIEGDAEGYWVLAQTIAAGETYSVYTPPRYALRMPGFPALLAIPIFFVGPSLFAARLTLACVGTFTCWLVYLLGRRVFNDQIGTIAATIAAFSPVLIVFSVEILTETAFAATLLWSLLSGEKLFRQLSTEVPNRGSISWQAILTGIAVAAGVYMRPSWILAAPIVALLLLLTALPGRRMLASLAGTLVVAGMVLALLPWGLRVQAVTGHFTLTTFWMGPSLYDGLNPHATGDSDMRFYDADGLMHRMDEFGVDQHYRKASRDFALQNPGRVAELALVKTWRYWKPWPNADQFGHPLVILTVLSTYLPVLFFSAWGACKLFQRPQTNNMAIPGNLENAPDWRSATWSVALLTGPIFYFAVLHMIFVSSLRYRLPAEYPLFVLAAYGMMAMVQRQSKRVPIG